MSKITIILFCLTMMLSCSSVSKKENNEYSKALEWVIDIVANNDAGYQKVINKKGYTNYLRFTDNMRQEIRQVDNEADCVLLIRKWLSFFRKEHLIFYSLGENNKNLQTARVEKSDSLHLKSLSKETLYLRITSFDYSEKSKIDSILKINENDIQSCENLIIDIRNSGGGSDRCWEGLIPYLYTNPVRGFVGEYKVSEANAKAYEYMAEMMNNDSVCLSMSERLRDFKGDFMPRNDNGSDVTVITKDKVLRSPKHIGVIINQTNASADESFLLFAKQSLKVKVFGIPTAGCYDFLNMNFVNSEDGKYTLGYAMSKSSSTKYMPLDGIGIQPDFLIGDDIQENKWVEYVQSVLEYN